MPIQVPGDPFGGGVATNSTQGLSLVDKKPAKYDRYALLQGLTQKDANLVMKKTREMEVAQAKEAINKLEQIRKERENDPQHGWKLTQGKNALERESGMSLQEEVEAGWNQDVAEALKGVKSQWGRNAVDEYVKNATEAQRQAIGRHVVQQEGVYQDAVDNQSLSTAQQMIMADDPKTVAQGLQLAEATCASVESRKGVPVDRTKIIGPMHTTIVGRMVQAGRISEARAYVKKHRDQIGATDLGRIDTAIKAHLKVDEIDSMVRADEKANAPLDDTRSPNQIILDIRKQNPNATPEQVQTAAAKVIAKRFQIQAAQQREHEAEIGAAVEHITAGGSISDFSFFDHLTEEEQKNLQEYENKRSTNSLVTNSALYYRLSNDDALSRISWTDLYNQRKNFSDKDFDFLVARKQTLANEGRSKAIPQTFMTAPKAVSPSSIKVDSYVRDALKMNGYVAKDKAHEAIFGRVSLVLNRIIGEEVRREGIPPEQVAEYTRKRTDQLLKTRISLSNTGWLSSLFETTSEAVVAGIATGETKLSINSDLEAILDAGINARGIGMPSVEARFEQLLDVLLFPNDPIPGAAEMAQAIHALDPTGYRELVEQFTERNHAAPTPSVVVQTYVSNKYARKESIAQKQAKFENEKEDK